MLLPNSGKPEFGGASRNDKTELRPVSTPANFFIIFVDRIFTVLIEPPFTNFFDRNAQNARIACVCRARNAN